MVRNQIIGLGLLAAALSTAQTHSGGLRETAIQKTRAWENLSNTLESRIGPLLPCDPKIESALNEASEASNARLQAVEDYYRAVLAEAGISAAKSENLLTGFSRSSGDLVNVERSETARERTLVDSQLAQLSLSASKRPDLAASQAALSDLVTVIDQRDRLMALQSAAVPRRLDSLRSVTSGFQETKSAFEALLAAQTKESAQWKAYYSARLARATAECAAISPPVPARPAVTANPK